jgi:site-specific recombinase XerD
VLESFLNLQNSPQTRRAYGAACTEALTAFAVEYPDELTPPMLTEWRAGLVARLNRNELSPASVALKLAALRAFLKFCRMTGLLNISAEVIGYTLESPSAKVLKPYEVLNPAEAARVIAILEGNPRDRALVALALGAGLRAAELTAVKVGDVITDDDGGQWVRVVQGKGRKDRLVPLSPDVASLLRAYMAGRKSKRGAYLFPSRQGESGRMTTARVWQIVTDAIQAAGIDKRLSPHSLRHTFAIGRLRAGASPVIVQKMLGHSSIATTQKYLDHIESAELQKWAAPLPK